MSDTIQNEQPMIELVIDAVGLSKTYDEGENTIFNGEIISLGFNPKNDATDIVSLYESERSGIC